MARFDEAALRRPEFVEGVPIELGDKQVWHFPEPMLTFRPARGEDGKFHFPERVRPTFGPEYDALVEAAIRTEGPAEELDAVLSLGVDLLGRNYTLSDEMIIELFPRIVGSEANTAMWQNIFNVGVGIPPEKPTASG